jgi:hypothetical protein
MESHTLIRDALITFRGANDIIKRQEQNQIYNWKQRIVYEASGTRLTGEDRENCRDFVEKSKNFRLRKRY